MLMPNHQMNRLIDKGPLDFGIAFAIVYLKNKLQQPKERGFA